MPINLFLNRLAISTLKYFFAMLLWPWWRYFRKETISGGFRGALVISGVLILVQGALGAYLWLDDFRPEGGEMHILYAGLAVLGLPVVFSVIRVGHNRKSMLIVGMSYLLLVFIIIRVIATG